jgi:hypothetical protein
MLAFQLTFQTQPVEYAWKRCLVRGEDVLPGGGWRVAIPCRTERAPYRVCTAIGMARLAALVPPPRMHLTRYHGVFAPHSKLRADITPAGRGLGAAKPPPTDLLTPPMPPHLAMSWARRLKRVFGIEIETCGGAPGACCQALRRRCRDQGWRCHRDRNEREEGLRRRRAARDPCRR